MKIRIAFGIIVFQSDYFLKQCLEAVYPFAHQIMIAEGPVKYWQDRGYTTSTDQTNEILHNFHDPEKKISIVHGQFNEKDDQCKAYMQYLKNDADYIWNLDSDEVFKAEDIETIIKLLRDHKYTSMSFRSCSFFGGFDRYISGFEEENDQFMRVFKVYPGSTWLGHRPPKIVHTQQNVLAEKHLGSDLLFLQHGVRMYHYSYVMPQQVLNKTQYYKNALTFGKGIENYFNTIYMPWVNGNSDARMQIERNYQGVHEYKPEYRRPTFTVPFSDEHPPVIARDLQKLKAEFTRQLEIANARA